MQIPNLLNMAISVVGSQQFTYLQYSSRITNAVGQDVSSYRPPVAMHGQVQPVPRNLYEQYGLDLQRNYLTFYISKDILDIQRSVSGDQMQFNGKTFNCLSEVDWFAINGWTGVLAVEVA